ncbi:MAG TPA: flagellin [Phycisphaerae bacterium]|jgi:flagellin|nr:flagellin [Phycisphaerae bacterium]HOJ55057.1 flagellin [Phycisphaerae bacterium]HOL27798.1 flagellin [Phycisphaerae bacterium]HPP22007.1 flagellin [Phycisphaerae bacterium]HPU33665.1 flagellin [Phycisphaerae bacterium]
MTRINSNISAIRAMHHFARNQGDMDVHLERLSTGLRINRGKDDPAGLIASETLRNEIRGISQAIDNSQRAISVLSTAEGALNEISALLLDIRGLITHASNRGAISNDELEADQLQIDSLLESIDRIANTTQFGGEKLINGRFAYTVSGLAASSIANATVFGARIPDKATQSVVVEVVGSAQTAGVVYTGSTIVGNVTIEVTGNKGTEIFSFSDGLSAEQAALAINKFSEFTGVSAAVVTSGGDKHLKLNSQSYGSDALVSVKPLDGNFIGAPGSTNRDTGQDATVLINGQNALVKGLKASLRSNGLDLVIDLTVDRATNLGTTTFHLTGGGATFQIGPNVDASGQVSIGIPSVATSNLGNTTLGFLNTIKGSGTHSVAQGHFSAAEDIVVEAISQVAIIRGRLGGLQKNQIETNINSQRIALENVQAAESAIRDADIAVEAAALTRSQILVQSTTTILGIANQLPYNVLSLLGG